jgi:hypothetical protein
MFNRKRGSMRVFGIILIIAGFAMLIWSAVVFAQKPETKAKARELKEDISQKAEDVKEDVVATSERVASEVEESVEKKTTPWPAWAGVAVLAIGLVIAAATSKKRTRTEKTVTTVTTSS